MPEGPFPDLDFSKFAKTPQESFKLWFHEAVAAGVREPHAMTVSTVDNQGCLDGRVLILKSVDYREWHFAVKCDSPKGKQLAENGHASLTLYWPQLARQVHLRGRAVELPEDESALDYQARPIESRISAVASDQSEVLRDPEALTQSLAEAEMTVSKDPLSGVNKWRVYAVAPDAVEFLQGDAGRLHRRLQYAYDPNESK